MYLLDTNVVSELRHPERCDPNVAAWADAAPPAALFISAISVPKIQAGALQVAARDPALGAVLHAWINLRVLPALVRRILPIDTEVALRCATLHPPAWRHDRDSLIVAIALVHCLTLVTRNERDFTPTGVAVLPPWMAGSIPSSVEPVSLLPRHSETKPWQSRATT